MTDHLEELVTSLLWEGYALYPYTPGATKNATPTPFGIVYPPAYASECPGAFDHARLECVAEPSEPGAGARLSATLRYLAPSGERHEATERRVELGPVPVGERVTTQFDGGRLTLRSERARRRLGGRALLRAQHPRGAGRARPRRRARPVADLDAAARARLRRPVPLPARQRPDERQHLPGARDRHDDAVLGTTYVLPDHPQIAPESRGGLFDSTEIEEALLLHVQVLSDDERAEIERADPAVREMIERAAAATPEDIIALHGRVEIRDPETLVPPTEPPGLPDPAAGQPEAIVDGVRFARGLKVVIRPGPGADIQARMLDGRTATIERILTDYDGRTHLGVTIDDDPGQDLMRETGRFLYFFAPEVEVIDT